MYDAGYGSGFGGWIDKVQDAISDQGLGVPSKDAIIDRINKDAKRTLGKVPAQQMEHMLGAVNNARDALKRDISSGISEGISKGAQSGIQQGGDVLKKALPWIVGGVALLVGAVLVLRKRR